MKKALNGLMVAVFFAVLLAAMGYALQSPVRKNLYENRRAVQIPVFSLPSAADGSFQEDLESSLHDQLPGSMVLEQTYQSALNGPVLQAVFAQSHANPNTYYQFNDLMLYHGSIVYAPVYPDDCRDELNARVNNINAVINAHPELSFYAFYIEKDTDMDFETGTDTGIAELLRDQLNLPKFRFAVHPVESYEHFRSNFYRTDHHWNRFGSYAGYQHVLQLLGKTAPLKPTGTQHLSDRFCGAKAITSGARAYFSEPFDVFTFDFPPMEVYINGVGPVDYGRQSQSWDWKEFGDPNYGSYYGFDDGEVWFRTQQTGAGNVLLLGESFDNAILKLLAGHFENLYAVDLRAYEADTGTPFSFSEYVAARGIDTVLFIGNIDFYRMEAFNMEG